MSEKISKTQRWLDLIALLVGRKYPVGVDQVMEKVPAYAAKYLEGDETARASVRRMFERDKDELRDLGIPIETVPNPDPAAEGDGAYRLTSRDFYLPYLRLLAGGVVMDPEPSPLQKAKMGMVEMPLEDLREAGASLARMERAPWFPLRGEAGSALRKLTFDLGGFEPGDAVLYVDRPDAAEIRDRVRTLSAALHGRKRVEFTYHGLQRGHATEREVAPYGLLFQKGHWYLAGRDEARDDVRVFRVGRMDALRPNARSPRTPDYEIPDDFSLDVYRDRDAWELGDEDDPGIRTRVRFEFPTSLWADRNAYGSLEEELPDGSSIRSFEVRQLNPFLRWILALEGRARVVDPPQVGAEVASLARDALALYAAEDETGDVSESAGPGGGHG